MDKYSPFTGREHYHEWPPYSPSDLRRKEAVVQTARQMLIGALTAPMAGGVSQIEGQLLYGKDELEALARKMEAFAYENDRTEEIYKYEAVMVRDSDAVLLLGDYRCLETPLDVGCGLCGGRPDCSFFYERHPNRFGMVDTTDRRSDTPIRGPLCGARVNDLGYAVGSALWLASSLFVDARPFMSVGMAGKALGFCPDSEIIVGIIVAGKAKNPCVDIFPDYHLFNMEKVVDVSRKQFITARIVPSYDYRKWRPQNKVEEE